MTSEINLTTFEPARGEDGDALLREVRYEFKCVKITLEDEVGDPLPSGKRTVRAFCFQIKGTSCSCSRGLEPLLVAKVEVGYPSPPYPPITLEDFMKLSVVLTLDYGSPYIVVLPREACIGDNGQLCWALTEVPPMVRVWSYVPAQDVKVKWSTDEGDLDTSKDIDLSGAGGEEPNDH